MQEELEQDLLKIAGNLLRTCDAISIAKSLIELGWVKSDKGDD